MFLFFLERAHFDLRVKFLKILLQISLNMPSGEKLAHFIQARAPMTTMMGCICSLGVIFLVYANYITHMSVSIEDPDVKLDWNTFFYNLNSYQFCIDDKVFTGDNPLYFNPDKYKTIYLTTVIQYLPLENYLSGTYHSRSDKYPSHYWSWVGFFLSTGLALIFSCFSRNLIH